MSTLLARGVGALIRRSLRRAFRRVSWVGPPPDLPPGRPVVLYANHHSFYDGYLAWLLAHDVLRRPPLTWMADWQRFPFFAAVGALPFPLDDPARRAATVRLTLRRLREEPRSLLVYFPEGRLHRPEEGLLPFDAAAFARLDRVLPDKLWWPVAIHVSWWGEARPTALLGAGHPHPRATGDERERLESAWQTLRQAPPGALRPLLEGRGGPDESWHFSYLSRWFERRL